MKYKKFQFYKMIIAFVLAAIIAGFSAAGNYIVPIVALGIAVLLMYVMKTKVKEVISDERIEKIAGKASYLTYTIATIGCALAGMVLLALRKKYPEYMPVSYTLTYVACGMILLYLIFYKYYNAKKV